MTLEEPVFEPEDVPETPAQAWAQLATMRQAHGQAVTTLAAVTRERDWFRQELLYLREELVDSDLHRERVCPADSWWEAWHRENLARLDKVIHATREESDA